VILDEAQRIKNWKTKIAQSVKKIRSPYALVLTGTPLENKLEELYSIVQFVDPFKLGPYYQFLDHYQIKNETGRVVGYNHLHEISRMLSDIRLRRTKKEVLSQLPVRMDKNLFVSMTEQQTDSIEENPDENMEPTLPGISGDDDVPIPVGAEPPASSATSPPVPEPAELISKGLGFLSGKAFGK